jgi:GNAT superfamily N-acetyltransferase
MPYTISLRPTTFSPEDLDVLRQVYGSTRVDELARTDWDSAAKAAFIDQQFTAQHQYYLENYPGAQHFIIQVDGQPAGRLYLHPRADEIRIMDIALLAEFRRLGVGGRVLRGVLEDGKRTGKRVTIHVERFNPALGLYHRMGFRVAEDRGVYLFLDWQPDREETTMLDRLTAADFAAHLHDTFTVSLTDGQPYPLELAAVEEQGESYQPGGRKPFSLLFRNPRTDAYLPQQIYRLEHPQMGMLEIFLVPLAPDTAGMRYEAVFH